MLQFEEYKVKLNNLKPEIEGLDKALGIEQAKREVEELEIKSSQPGFWDNPEESQKIVSRMGSLKGKVEAYGRMCTLCDDLLTICEMAIEEDDESMLEELENGFKELEETVAEQKLGTLLTGEYDSHNALVSFHAGAGGTEAQDWCAMLYRMYTRWAERHGFTYKIMDYQDGDTAGIKSADILIEGENAYGFLKGENGVHRLVRISPFDASGRRQTSFSAVEVVPDIPDTSADFEIKPDDYEMQVYRSSGAGGQHINKTSSAVRLIHCSCLPDRAKPAPEQGELSAHAALQAGRDQGARAPREDLRHQGRSAEDRMGQPDPLLRFHAVHPREGYPYRLREREHQRSHGRRS